MRARPGKMHDMHRCVVWLNGAQIRAVDHLKGFLGPTRGQAIYHMVVSYLHDVSGTPLLPAETVHALAARSRAASARRRRRGRR